MITSEQNEFCRFPSEDPALLTANESVGFIYLGLAKSIWSLPSSYWNRQLIVPPFYLLYRPETAAFWQVPNN